MQGIGRGSIFLVRLDMTIGENATSILFSPYIDVSGLERWGG
jgi:hypothetical protein